jgi:uncharacterized protein
MAADQSSVPLEVIGVRVEMPSNQPVVLLRDSVEGRYVPIWIGAVEASAIAFAQQGVVPTRPLTHDLFCDTLAALGVTLAEVRITDLRDGVFYSVLVLRGPAGVIEVSARPSDAIALAVRLGVPVLGTHQLIAEAGIDLPSDDEDPDEGASEVDSEVALEQFREFLDQVSPEDFASGEEGSGPGN